MASVAVWERAPERQKFHKLLKSYVLITSCHCHGGSEEYTPSRCPRTPIPHSSSTFCSCPARPGPSPLPWPCGDIQPCGDAPAPPCPRALLARLGACPPGAPAVVGEERSPALAGGPGVRGVGVTPGPVAAAAAAPAPRDTAVPAAPDTNCSSGGSRAAGLPAGTGAAWASHCPDLEGAAKFMLCKLGKLNLKGFLNQQSAR